MNITIKQSQKDNAEIKSFEKREWQLADIEHYGKDNKYFKKTYKFIAQDDNKNILGTLDLSIEPNVAFIEGLLVTHKLKRKGIGKKLLKQGEEFAQKQKCKKIWLETNQDWGAAKFYQKMGYELTGIHENHVFGQKTLILTKFF